MKYSQSEVDNLVKELIGIIQRSLTSYSESERQKLWISLLDVLNTSENFTDQKGNFNFSNCKA